jgi:hypothetical protein
MLKLGIVWTFPVKNAKCSPHIEEFLKCSPVYIQHPVGD